MPAMKPPRVMASSDMPLSRYPTATPGRMACDSASPIRLMRRSSRKTPSMVVLSDSARHTTRARRIKPNSMKG